MLRVEVTLEVMRWEAGGGVGEAMGAGKERWIIDVTPGKGGGVLVLMMLVLGRVVRGGLKRRGMWREVVRAS